MCQESQFQVLEQAQARKLVAASNIFKRQQGKFPVPSKRQLDFKIKPIFWWDLSAVEYVHEFLALKAFNDTSFTF